LELFVGNAGTAARFLAAMVCFGNGVYRLSGVPRMHERPQAALFKALRELGYRVDATNDKLPAVIHGEVAEREKAVSRSKPATPEAFVDSGRGMADDSAVGHRPAQLHGEHRGEFAVRFGVVAFGQTRLLECEGGGL
jgi:hypothetical protein